MKNNKKDIIKMLEDNGGKLDRLQADLNLFHDQALIHPITKKTKRKVKGIIIKILRTIKNCLSKIKHFMKNNKVFKLIALLFTMLLHPTRASKLIKTVKKGKITFGCFSMDMLYLKEGEIELCKEKPLVSIIIPVYNQIDYTYKCLKSIEKYTKDVPYEVIIADDVSYDGTIYLNDYVKNVNVIRNSQNTGFLKNCNNGAKISKGKYVLFLNNDTQVTKNWLSSLVNLIESDDSIGMVGSKLVYPDGRLQEAGGIIYSDGSGCNYGKLDDPNKPQYNYVRDVDYISGASIMIPKKLWNLIGGFDERYVPAYCEDSDMAFEIRKAGYRVVYQPASVVIHFEGISNGTDVNNTSGLKHYQIQNQEKLKTKWAKELKIHPSSKLEKDDISLRDRLSHKGTILVVDHYVPEFDKDAGSRTTFQYLKMFIEKGYTVKFLGDNFYNKEPYTSILEQMGIEVLYGPEYANNIFKWIDINKNNIDVVYLNRPHISIKYIDYITRNTNIKIIYYGHDLHFLREKREYELTGDESKLASSNNWKTIEYDLMCKADQVYYPSYIEEEEIKKMDPNINVKAINAYLFDNIDEINEYDYDSREGIMFVGGFNHTPNVDGVKWFVKEVYPLIKKKNKDIKFTIVGSNPPDEIKALNSNDITVTGFVSDEELAKLYNKCRIVVAPLRYGAGIKGKVIEAMSKGLPIVTTSIGAEGIKNVEDVISVEDEPQRFAEEILKLYDNKTELINRSNKMKKYIKDNYSTEAAWNIIKNDFVKRSDCLIVTPDGYGCYGDEAMIFGALSLVENDNVKLISPRKELWIDNLKKLPENILEEYIEPRDFVNKIKNVKKLIVIGADILDGTYDIDNSLNRLKLANQVASLGGKSYIFCSFRSDADDKVLDFISTMNDDVKFFLRDEISYKNFKLLTGKDATYMPDLAFFVNKIKTPNNTDIVKELLLKKREGYNLVGLNFAETSFRSMYKEYTKENKNQYVSNIIKSISKATDKKIYYVLLCHDIRHWDDYSSDADYQIIAEEVLKELKIKDYMLLDSNKTHLDLLNILPALDTVITARMHLAVASFRSEIIPIIYTGNKTTGFNNMDKMRGMFINRIGTASFVVNNEKELKERFEEVLDPNNEKIYELKEKLKQTCLKDEEYKQMLIELMEESD